MLLGAVAVDEWPEAKARNKDSVQKKVVQQTQGKSK